MKKLILLCLIFSAFSCTKNLEPSSPEIENSNFSNREYLNQAKETFNERKVPVDGKLAGSLNYFQILPDWDSAKILNLSFGKGILIPIRYSNNYFIETASFNGVRLPAKDMSMLFAYKDTIGDFKFEIIKSLPDFSYLQGESFSFLGKIAITDMANGNSKVISPKVLGQNQISGLRVASDCTFIDWYSCTSTGCRYIYTEQVGSCGTAGGSGSIIPTYYDYQYVNPIYHGGTGSPTTSSILKTIDISNLTNPCLKSTAEMVINADKLYSNTANILYYCFDVKDPANITFLQSTTMNNDDDGITTGQKSGDYINMNITLNVNTLSTASKEYIAITIMHEVLHGYLNVENIKSKLEQHEIITSLIDYMANDLKQIFGNITLDDAKNLAWGGLQETSAYANLSDVKKNAIITTNRNYKTAIKGTKCL